MKTTLARLTIAGFLTFAVSIAPAATLTYTIDPSQSALSFSGILTVPNPFGGGTIMLPINVDSNTSGDDLTTSLGGTVDADAVAGTLGTMGAITQLEDMQGSILNGSTHIGAVLVPNETPLVLGVNGSMLPAVAGSVSYSFIPAFGGANGNISLAGLVLAAGTPVFGSVGNQNTVDFEISYSGLIPTGSFNGSLTGTFSGSVRGVAFIPEPSSLILMGLSLNGLLALYRRNRLRQGV